MREALRILEGEKLIVNVPHKGPSVAVPSPEEAKQIYEVRIELEALLGRYAAANATKAQVVALHSSVDLFDIAARADDLGEMVRQADIFYSILFEMSGNTIVVDLLQKLRARINTLRATSMSQRGRGSHSTKEMRAIANAVKKGDPELAAKALAEHVRQATAAALSKLGPDSAVETARSNKTPAPGLQLAPSSKRDRPLPAGHPEEH